MPLYQYQCGDCQTLSDHFYKIADKPDNVSCPACDGVARKVLSPAMVLGDDMPAWMRHEEVLGCLQSRGDKNKITTRGEYNAHLKKHNIIETSATSEL